MEGIGYACAVVLAAIFVRAAVAKLGQRGVTAASFKALGVPGSATAARTVPILELVVAALLLAAPRAGVSMAVGLLLAFTFVLRRAIRGGSTAPCNCLGSARAEPVSRVDIWRNGMLLVLAVGAALAVGPVVPSPAAVLIVLAVVYAGHRLYRMLRDRWPASSPAGSS